MKLIIDIPKGEYDKICKTMMHTSSGNPNFYFESKIANGTPIPDNATNGDVIHALFPNAQIGGVVGNLEKSWWNAPYQKGGLTQAEIEHYNKLAEHYNQRRDKSKCES